MTRIPRLAMFLAVSALPLLACAPEAEAPTNDAGGQVVNNEVAGPLKEFNLAGSDGAALGKVSISADASGISLAIDARAMPAGMHGIHLHQKGLCEGPKFESAGAHWNPASKKHGRDNPAGAHLGDLANLEVGANGAASVKMSVAGATMTSGATMLADDDGTALIVHAKPDDYKTDPSGASGDRIACAVIAPPK